MIRITKTRAIGAGVVVGVMVIGGSAWAVLRGSSNEIDSGRLATVERGDVAKSVVATGRIEPIAKVEIKSKANGIIKDLKVDVGDQVTVGQVLVELDKDNLAARLRESRAALTGAQANLSAAEAEYEKNKVEAEGPDVPLARRNLGRAESLYGSKLVSQQTLDDARGALDVAVNKQLAAKTQLGVAQARMAQARASVAAAQAAVDRTEEELTNATIRSPIDGMVLARPVELGSPVSSILNMGANATLVMVLGDISKVYVKGNVDEADIGTVRLGQPARIKVETFRQKQFDGKVTQISPMGTDKDNVISFEVKVSIDNSTGELLANMTANAEIILEEHKATLLVPEAAIVYDAKRNASVDVYMPSAKSGRERRPITVGVSNGTKTQVLGGLMEGQRVVLQ
ncbi:MAG: efflux RND transporter periplasmic adaptor subunit [Acidobacteria bacterium]|nr:efflux RND transporter periplasmic adaptor subunit [Acidobacteriota bacterium]